MKDSIKNEDSINKEDEIKKENDPGVGDDPRHAKSRESGNLVPRHFWSKIWTFSEIKTLDK